MMARIRTSPHCGKVDIYEGMQNGRSGQVLVNQFMERSDLLMER